MKIIKFLLLLLTTTTCTAQIQDKSTYLNEIKKCFKEGNGKRINLVFHGHSVPSGLFESPYVNTLESYPYQLLKLIKNDYPFAMLNVIISAKSGENSEQGSKRFDNEVLNYHPDVLFIDYALNDAQIGVEASRRAITQMVKKALAKNIKVILLTPSPDLQDTFDSNSILVKYDYELKSIAAELKVACANVYDVFKNEIALNSDINEYMAQYNHPNQKGHEVIANELYDFFKQDETIYKLESAHMERAKAHSIKVYPFKNKFIIEVFNEKDQLTVEFYDTKGNILESKKITEERTEIGFNQTKLNPSVIKIYDQVSNVIQCFLITKK